jgi:hypothetical protein
MRKQLQRSELVASDHPVPQKLLAGLLRFNRDEVQRIFHEDLGKRKMRKVIFTQTDGRTLGAQSENL